MCTASRAFSCVIVIFNVIGVLFSLIVIGIGGIILWGGPLLTQLLEPFTSKMKESMSDYNINFTTVIGDVVKYLINVGLLFFIMGLILLTTCILACVGATRSKRIVLIIYAVLVGTIFVLLMILLIATMTPLMLNFLSSNINDVIKTKFNENSNANGQTLLVTMMQFELQCCGVANGNDFNSANKWNRTYSKTLSSGKKILTQLKYPVSCCVSKNYVPVNYDCTTAPNTTNSNYNIGCETHLNAKVKSYSSIIGVIIGIPEMITGILLTMTILLIKVLEKHNKVDAE